jgi:hypothetical protein
MPGERGVKLSQSRGVLRIDSEILADGVFYRERGLLSSNETKVTLGTWMQSPKYVGYLTSRGGLLFFDKKGAQDPNRFLEEIQQARAAYLHGHSPRGIDTPYEDNPDSNRGPVH